VRALPLVVAFALLQTVSIVDCCCGMLCAHKGACDGCGSTCIFREPVAADC